MTDEELVEEAAKAIADVHNPGAFEKWPDGWMKEAEVALAVFREHTAPTGDEREAMFGAVYGATDHEGWAVSEVVDAVLAAGFRRGAPADRCGIRANWGDQTCRLASGHDGEHMDGRLSWMPGRAPAEPAPSRDGLESLIASRAQGVAQ